jgi:hypothetical protein
MKKIMVRILHHYGNDSEIVDLRALLEPALSGTVRCFLAAPAVFLSLSYFSRGACIKWKSKLWSRFCYSILMKTMKTALPLDMILLLVFCNFDSFFFVSTKK